MRYTYKVRELIQGLEDFTEVGEATQMEAMSFKKLRSKLDPNKDFVVEYTNKKGHFISTVTRGKEPK